MQRFRITLKPGRKAAKNFQDTRVLPMDLRNLWKKIKNRRREREKIKRWQVGLFV